MIMKIKSLITGGFRVASDITFFGGIALGGALIPTGVFAFGIGVLASLGLGVGIMIASYALSKGLEYCANRIEKSSQKDFQPSAFRDEGSDEPNDKKHTSRKTNSPTSVVRLPDNRAEKKSNRNVKPRSSNNAKSSENSKPSIFSWFYRCRADLVTGHMPTNNSRPGLSSSGND